MLHLPGYALSRLLQEGDHAFIAHALRERDRRPVIVKIVWGHNAAPQPLQCLRNEYQIASSLRSGAVVHALELVTLPDGLALVLEDKGGCSLDQLCGQPMAPGRFLPLAVRIAEALAEVHKEGVIHKDIKPHNIVVLAADQTSPAAYLTDFGIATRLLRDHPIELDPGCIEGTLAYLSPEQTGRMNRAIDWRTDLYSLGVTFYELLTGAVPFHGQAVDPIEWLHAHVARVPVPPAQLLLGLPTVISDIVMRMMAKQAGDRYQSARGVAHDLGRCLEMLRERGRCEPFALMQRDHSGRFQVSQIVYGRQAELAVLSAAWERVAKSGNPEFVLLTGPTGIGKTTLVNELVSDLHRPLVVNQGFLLSGRFDVSQPGMPYAALQEALGGLLKRILAEDEPALLAWRDALWQALGPDGDLMAEVMPQMALILHGPAQGLALSLPGQRQRQQAAPAGAAPADAQQRFGRAVGRFLGVFARREHPLVLFLDDLQLADEASLHVLQALSVQPDLRSLLLILAWRTGDDGGELDEGHPLHRTLAKIRQGLTPGSVQLALMPLTVAAVAELVAATVHCPAQAADGLAQVVHRKTGGNPLFIGRFLQALHHEGLLRFDESAASFTWDLAQVEGVAVTDNVVETMAGTVRGLHSATQGALRVAACQGDPFDPPMLATILRRTGAEIRQDLWPALAAELIVPLSGGRYRFAHDRIQQVALSLIPPDERPGLHLQVGRALLCDSNSEGEAGADPFLVARHLNAAVDLLDDAERRLLCRLDLSAGRRARQSGAMSEAHLLLQAGLAALPADGWQTEYDSAFALHCELAACAHLRGGPHQEDQAEALLAEAQRRARTALDQAEVLALLAQHHVDLGRYGPSLDAAIAGLRLLGIELPAQRADWAPAVPAALGRMVESLAQVDIAGLLDRPPAGERRDRLAARILGTMLTSAYAYDGSLWALAAATLVRVLLVAGHTDESAIGYAAGGALFVTALSDYATGSRMGRLALDLLEKPDMKARRVMALAMICGLLHYWNNPFSSTIALVREGLRMALDDGDLRSACMMQFTLAVYRFNAGHGLDQVLSETDSAIEFTGKQDHPFSNRPLIVWRQAIRALRGRTAGLTDLSDDGFDPTAFVASEVTGKANTATVAYLGSRMVLAAVAGDVALGLHVAQEARAVWFLLAGRFGSADFALYHVLILGAAWDRQGGQDSEAGQASQARPALLAEMERQCQALHTYAAVCPVNFAGKHALASAELHRLRWEDAEASRAYEQAISHFRGAGFTHIEALAHEAAARFYAARGREGVARGYLEDARAAYVRWGADAKVEQLTQQLGQRPAHRSSQTVTGTMSVRSGQLDTMAAVKASQAISTELVLHRLTHALLQIAIDNAGAQLGYLIMPRQGGGGGDLWVEAAVGSEADGQPPFALASGGPVPQSIIEYVRRTGDRVLLADGGADSPFAADADLLRSRARSVLCLPMLRQGQLRGLLYLENNLIAGAFTVDRIALLEVLVAQAAISIENARLYEEQEGRVEERTRELRAAQQELVATARKAGMAEIATGILHNVGNALNSVNVSATMIDDWLRRSKLASLSKTTALLRAHEHDLGPYLTLDPKGRQVPGFLNKLAETLETERKVLLAELKNLARGIEHIREIVRTQQRYAGASVLREEVRLADVMEDGLRMSTESLIRHEIKVVRDFAELPPLMLDKHKLLQILINLMSNAKRAMDATPLADRVMTLRIGLDADNQRVRIVVEDRGVGIAEENLMRIFSHGFTTKPDGHGFGLHSSVLAAREMMGTLQVSSEGAGKGARFTLELPVQVAGAADPSSHSA